MTHLLRVVLGDSVLEAVVLPDVTFPSLEVCQGCLEHLHCTVLRQWLVLKPKSRR